jgi:Amt family ammonium transporter
VSPDELKVAADTAWTLLTGFLVFFMNAGFGLVEAGLCRRKNATMILSKNFVVFAIATLGFYAVGFGLMFSGGGGDVAAEPAPLSAVGSVEEVG